MFKESRILLAFWLFILLINFGFAFHVLPFNWAISAALVNILFQLLVFYSNYFVLFPRYFKMQDNFKFFVYTALLIFLAAGMQMGVESLFFRNQIEFPRHPKPPQFIFIYFRSFFWLVLVNLISTVFLLQKRIREQSEHTRQIKEEKLVTELELLKAQINPHFIFNALNNIYSLAYLKSEKAPESILELSQMLRYVIEDCRQEKVALGSEIEYIKNYIAFQKLKSQWEQQIEFDYGHADGRKMIAPMLFMPFIENSFKYSRIEEADAAFIKIELRTDGDELNFRIENTKPEKNPVKSGPGLGLKNVRKRLEIIYDDQYTLRIDDNVANFTVNLGIYLK